jgi:N4-gp56 family major capsid protein
MATTLTSNLTQTILDIYSKEIEFQAQPVLRFAQFAVQKTDLQAQSGLTVKVTIYDNLALGGQLSENTPIGTQALSTSQKEISVTEWGNAIAVTELLLQASFDDVMGSAAKLLGMDYARVLDNALKNTVLGGTQVIYAGNKTARNLIAVGDKFSGKEVKDGVEVLSTNNAGKYSNDYYVCMIHPHHARGVRDDSEFMNVTAYGKQYAGEIGRIHDVVFVETTQMPVLANAGATGAEVYQAVMFGENAYALAIALPVEMRDGGVEDFGRVHKLAWYSIFGTGILQDNNIVRIETN